MSNLSRKFERAMNMVLWIALFYTLFTGQWVFFIILAILRIMRLNEQNGLLLPPDQPEVY